MKRINFVLFVLLFSCAVFAQDRLSIFLGSANRYAEVELSDYRKRLCVEYNVSDRMLDRYYRQCGRNWGNVGIALEIAHVSGRNMRDVCDYYGRYHRHGWRRVLVEIGISPNSRHYHSFYDRIYHHSGYWDNCYHSYCDRHHGKVHKHPHKHYKKKYKHPRRRHRHYDDDDDDDDED